MYNDNAYFPPPETAGQLAQLQPKQMTRRERLEFQRKHITEALRRVDKAIAALDAHPDLEEFMEVLARAGA